uniref:Endoplasmic reticulum transmembrane protein n=1 Tax=Clastoptera arizonana TaxID=38151 RepID=A0A1B6EE10_9HEMI
MSLQWTLIASFLYVEIAIVLLFVLPVASPKRWQKLFKSRFLQVITSQASWYFGFIMFVLVLFLLDAVREMRKYSHTESSDQVHAHLDAEMQGNMRLFRAQRNFYISGFSLFLSLVIRRLITLISEQATLLAQSEAAFKQAQSATTAATELLSKKGAGEATSNDKTMNEINELKEKLKELNELKEELESTKHDLNFEKKDKEALKSQAASLEKEYDRLLEEHQKLQLKVSVQTESKKDE